MNDDIDAIRLNLNRLAPSAKSFLLRLPIIKKRYQWLERTSSGDPGARRLRDKQYRAISAYYEQFGGFDQDAYRTIQALNRIRPQGEFTELVRHTAPSESYQVARICNTVLRAQEIFEEIYPSNISLLNRILEKKDIGLETWLGDHHFKRTAFMDWKAAGGKPVKGKVSAAKAREFEQAILQDAMDLGLK